MTKTSISQLSFFNFSNIYIPWLVQKIAEGKTSYEFSWKVKVIKKKGKKKGVLLILIVLTRAFFFCLDDCPSVARLLVNRGPQFTAVVLESS